MTLHRQLIWFDWKQRLFGRSDLFVCVCLCVCVLLMLLSICVPTDSLHHPHPGVCLRVPPRGAAHLHRAAQVRNTLSPYALTITWLLCLPKAWHLPSHLWPQPHPEADAARVQPLHPHHVHHLLPGCTLRLPDLLRWTFTFDLLCSLMWTCTCGVSVTLAPAMMSSGVSLHLTGDLRKWFVMICHKL